MGAEVDEVSSYTVRKPRVNPDKMKQLFKSGEIDLITFTSPSTFTNFISMMKGVPLKKLLKGVKVAAIGPVTKKEITGQGIGVAVTASHHTVPGLVEAITSYYQPKK